MEKKKPTNAQLLKRIEKAICFVERDKDYRSIYFSDKGLKIECTQDYCVISTNYHKHVFTYVTSGGVSQPYLYVSYFLDIANRYLYEITENNGQENYYSYRKLLDILKAIYDQDGECTDYIVAFYVDMYLFNIFTPLYEVGDSTSTQFMTYLHYCENLARTMVQLDEHKKDVTNKEFILLFVDKLKELTQGLKESVIYKKLTDSEFAEREIKAMNAQEIDIDTEMQYGNVSKSEKD
jgi:hypothetical protein